MYVVPTSDTRIVIPFDKTCIETSIGSIDLTFPAEALLPPAAQSLSLDARSSAGKLLTVSASTTEAIITGPGQVWIHFCHQPANVTLLGYLPPTIKIYCGMLPAAFDDPITFDCTLSQKGGRKWRYRAPPYYR